MYSITKLLYNIRRKLKNHKKRLNAKLRFIQEKALRQITKIYKAILTKILQIEINRMLIDIYLRKLTQKSITSIKLRISNAIITKIIRRICNDLISKRDRKSKLRKIFFQLKQK